MWCDVKNTHAGESAFWLKVQKKIENEAAKFIFILSNSSRDFEKKRGIYKEVQAADNTKRDNFILPLRIEKLAGSVPIIISPDLHISSENWAEGLRELQGRLIEDGVPRVQKPDYDRIVSWWPAVSAREVIVRETPEELASNVFRFAELPESIHFLKISSEGNPLRGRDQLKGALPSYPTYSAHGDYAITFARANDYLEMTSEYDIVDALVMPTKNFLENGLDQLSIPPQTAQNITTYLIASAFENFLEDNGLRSKALNYSRRKIWFPGYDLMKGNRHSFSESGRRKVTVSFVGAVSHFRKKYIWHFGIQPTIDLRTHFGILFSPRVIISAPYRSDRNETPVPLDEKRVTKKLNWWNKEWRNKILGFADWLAKSQQVIRVPTGYQEVLIAATPETLLSGMSYLQKDDDAVIKEIMDWGDA